MIMENAQIDITNYEIALMQAEEMSRLAAKLSTFIKNLFTFGSLRHA